MCSLPGCEPLEDWDRVTLQCTLSSQHRLHTVRRRPVSAADPSAFLAYVSHSHSLDLSFLFVLG